MQAVALTSLLGSSTFHIPPSTLRTEKSFFLLWGLHLPKGLTVMLIEKAWLPT